MQPTLWHPALNGEALIKTHEELLNIKWREFGYKREYFMADSPFVYTYGSEVSESERADYTAHPFTENLRAIMQEINQAWGLDFNACLIKKYENEHCQDGWHYDAFPEMREDQPIAMLHFGAEREIWFKEKSFKGDIPTSNKYQLKDDSLFLMPVGFQDSHLHKIPNPGRPCDCSIIVTFRSFK